MRHQRQIRHQLIRLHRNLPDRKADDGRTSYHRVDQRQRQKFQVGQLEVAEARRFELFRERRFQPPPPGSDEQPQYTTRGKEGGDLAHRSATGVREFNCRRALCPDASRFLAYVRQRVSPVRRVRVRTYDVKTPEIKNLEES